MKRARVLIAEIKHECNTFSPVRTELANFRDYHYYEGAEIEHLRGTGTEVSAFLDVAAAEGWDAVPALATMAMSSGMVTADAYSSLKSTLLHAAESAGPLDGVLIALHGAMVADGLDDAEGDLLATLRAVVGRRPIAASLDLHAVVTPAMVANADILVGFDTCPHTDLYDTGRRAARLLAAHLRQAITPVCALVRVPLVVAPDTMDTSDGPLGEIVAEAKSLETQPHILSASVFCAQPWLDIPALSSAVVVVGHGQAAETAAAAQLLACSYWRARRRFAVDLQTPEEAVAGVMADGRGPVVFSDSADSIGSGATGDATGLLREILAVQQALPGPALTTVVDPEAAGLASAAGLGAQVRLLVGGKRDVRYNSPVALHGRVWRLFGGRFRLTGPSYSGLEMDMGKTVIVQAGRVFVVITSLPTWTHHPDFYRAVGLDPKEALIVVCKSNILFKASYRDLARRMVWVNSPGLSSPDIARLPFTRITRPLYPIDDQEAFDDRVTLHIGR